MSSSELSRMAECSSWKPVAQHSTAQHKRTVSMHASLQLLLATPRQPLGAAPEEVVGTHRFDQPRPSVNLREHTTASGVLTQPQSTLICSLLAQPIAQLLAALAWHAQYHGHSDTVAKEHRRHSTW